MFQRCAIFLERQHLISEFLGLVLQIIVSHHVVPGLEAEYTERLTRTVYNLDISSAQTIFPMQKTGALFGSDISINITTWLSKHYSCFARNNEDF